MPTNALAENIFGTIGAILWTVQLIPQLIKTWRTKSVEGLSPWLVFLWGIAALPLGVYAIAQDLNVPLIVQPQLFGLFSLLSWGQCMYYGGARSRLWCVLVLGGTLVIWGTLEAALVYALRPSYRRGTSAGKSGVRFFGVMSAALISVAVLPQFYEIYKHGAVLGISLTFMAVDLLGGIFSILSLIFKNKVDVLAAITYSLVVVMDGLVLVLAIILKPRSKKVAQRGEQKPRAGASDNDGSGSDLGAGTARVMTVTVMPASGGHNNKERSAEEDHLTSISVTS